MASVYKRKLYAPIPSGAEIVEEKGKRIAKWIGESGGRPRKAPVETHPKHGDRIIFGEAEKWTIPYDSDRGRQVLAGYTDYDASLAKAQRLEREAGRRAEGLTDNFERHRKTNVSEHLKDFLDSRPSRATSASYLAQFKKRLERVIAGIGARRLDDLDSVEVERFFKRDGIAGLTRNEYVGGLKAFTAWSVNTKRISDDPLATLSKTPLKKIEPKHPRRAVTAEQVAALLDAAERRPVLELTTIRRGKHKGQPRAKVREWVIEKARALGRARRLVYLIAVWAGLRRSEIRALCWGDVHLDGRVPRIHLRGPTTKSKRADTVALHPQLAEELRRARPVSPKAADRVVLSVPDMKAFTADLALAGIAYQDEFGRYFDLHAARKTLNTLMAAHGMSQRSRQAHMRHTDPRLTDNTYLDEQHLPVSQELSKLPPLPIAPAATEAATGYPKQGGRAAPSAARAALMQRKVGSVGQTVATPNTTWHVPVVDVTPLEIKAYVEKWGEIRQRLAGNDKARQLVPPGLLQERVKGLEPSTFTLAT